VETNPTATTPAGAKRPDGRRPNELRPLRFENGIAPHAAGSTLVVWGNTRVICGVTVEEVVPRWMKEKGIAGGWLTAEYSMLPYSTLDRKSREISRGRPEGRSQEIQRLIGRAIRAAVDLGKLGTRTLWVDCDVLQADGGTRTASITGGYVALVLAVRRLLADGRLSENPIRVPVAGLSVGMVAGEPRLDLNYAEDAGAEVDLNLVMTGRGDCVEVQGTGEKGTFTPAQLDQLLALGRSGITQLLAAQEAALNTLP